MAKHKNSVDKLFSSLAEICWRRAPYRGLMKKIGLEAGYPEKYARTTVYKAIFHFHNVDLAVKLMEEVNKINEAAEKVLCKTSR